MEYINRLMKLARSQIGQPNSLIFGMSGSGKAFSFVAKREISMQNQVPINREIILQKFGFSERLLKYVTSSKHGIYGITPALIEELG